MKTSYSISSATLEFRFDPGLKIKVYIDTALKSKEIQALLIDQHGVIKRVIAPQTWDDPNKMIAEVQRGDLSSIEAWAQKYIKAAQRESGWLVAP